ncbi:MAG: Npun_R2821/Npun_R2822 family protein [Phormidium sp.]
MDGICTLANDKVYDQLIALLNSIEVILGSEIPVCVYPYDDKTTRIAAEISRRPNVQLYDDQYSIHKWDKFVRAVWDSHPTACESWSKLSSERYHRVGTHRRFCAFDGPFERFIYIDADTLIMGSMEPIFAQLNTDDFVVYDFQHTDPTHVYELSSPKLTQVFPQERIKTEIFCSGFYASKKDLFSREQMDRLLSQLQAGEAEILYINAPDQTVLNYLVMRSGVSSTNLALSLPKSERTGCCVTSLHFQEKDHILYDSNNQRLTYIHYIGISSKYFSQLCAGENIDFPYRDLFLHYRYLHEPEKRPKFTGKPKPYNPPPSLASKVLRKLGLTR